MSDEAGSIGFGSAPRPGENPEVGNISGYRKLSQDELNLVNRLKADGVDLKQTLSLIEGVIRESSTTSEQQGERMRALALGKTNLQQAYMWLIRAVAAPEGLV